MSDLILYYFILVGGLVLAGLLVYFIADRQKKAQKT